jgi:hypothetical protein
MCSILCRILSIWEALGCIFCIFGLIHALSTRGRSLSLFWATKCISKVFRWFRAISGLCCAPVWPVEVTGRPVRVLVLCTCWAPVWPVAATGLTGQSRADVAALFLSSGLHAFVQGDLHWFRGSLHVCRGSSSWFSSFGLVVCAHCLSIVLSQMCRAIAFA